MILDFKAMVKGGDGSVVPFSLQIRAPRYDENRGYCCEIACPYLTDKNFLIFGVDEKQARELSYAFIGQRLADENVLLVDEEGHDVSVPNLVDD